MFKLNYNGKIGNQIGEILGPNEFNERFVVTGQKYDTETNRSTLSLEIYRGN